jgi:hypothetical protein
MARRFPLLICGKNYHYLFLLLTFFIAPVFTAQIYAQRNENINTPFLTPEHGFSTPEDPIWNAANVSKTADLSKKGFSPWGILGLEGQLNLFGLKGGSKKQKYIYEPDKKYVIDGGYGVSSTDSGFQLTAIHEIAHNPSEVLEPALQALRGASNKRLFLNAANQQIYRTKWNDPTSEKINSVLKNSEYDEYTAELAVIYNDVSVGGAHESKEAAGVFQRYLDNGDYFSERLRLEIDRQRNLISQEFYKSRLTDLFERYTAMIQLPDSARNPAMIGAVIVLMCTDLDNAKRELTTYEKVSGVVKDIAAATVPFLMFFVAIQMKKLAKLNYLLAERKEGREARDAAKKENVLRIATIEEVERYSWKN